MVYNKVVMKTLKVHPDTKKELDKRRHPGQTYDGVIRELIAKVQSNEKTF